jgi:hypothetical protein
MLIARAVGGWRLAFKLEADDRTRLRYSTADLFWMFAIVALTIALAQLSSRPDTRPSKAALTLAIVSVAGPLASAVIVLPAVWFSFRLRPMLGAVFYATYLLGLVAAAISVLGLVYGYPSHRDTWNKVPVYAAVTLIVLVSFMIGSLFALRRSGFVLLSRH